MIERIPAVGEPEAALTAAGIRPERWTAPPGAVFAAHRHERIKRLFVTAGSITFDDLELVRGDGIRIPAGHEHGATAGREGVECVEGFE